jgi:hypothetical protein
MTTCPPTVTHMLLRRGGIYTGASAHFLLVFSAQKVEKSLAIAPAAPDAELVPATLRKYNALKGVRTDLSKLR